jgi:ribosomal protein S18 acetylase RimI-like enzyme
LKAQGIEIVECNNARDRAQAERLWKKVFGYDASHNEPGLVIDKKLAVCDGLFFVALSKREVIGTVIAGYDGHRGWIYSLAVAPTHQRRGVGTELLKLAEKELCIRGCLKINLQIVEENKNVAAFYLSNGYKTEKRISMGRRVDQSSPNEQ